MSVKNISGTFSPAAINHFYEKTRALNIDASIEDEMRIYGATQDKIDLFVQVKLNTVTDNEDYASRDFTHFDGGGFKDGEGETITLYDGEVLALTDLESVLNETAVIDGIKVAFRVDVSYYNETVYAKEALTIGEFENNAYDERLRAIKEALTVSDFPNVYNSAEAREKFSQNATDQHFGESEAYMVQLQKKITGGDVNYLIEHMGDLLHRMSQGVYVNNGSIESSLNDILPKIRQALPMTKRSGGLLSGAFMDRLKSNYEYNNSLSWSLEKTDFFDSFDAWKTVALDEMFNSAAKLTDKIEEIETFSGDTEAIDKVIAYRHDKLKVKVSNIDSDIKAAQFEAEIFSEPNEKQIEGLQGAMFVANKAVTSFSFEQEKQSLIKGLQSDKEVLLAEKQTIKSAANSQTGLLSEYEDYKQCVEAHQAHLAPFETFKRDIVVGLQEYASLHASLLCYNDAQYYARKAAISVGLLDVDGLRDSLLKLKALVDNESFVKIASGYNPDYDKTHLKVENKADTLVMKMQGVLPKVSQSKKITH
jgi:hypothetical protein